MEMYIMLNSDGEVLGTTDYEDLLDLMEDTGWRGRRHVQNLAISNSFHQMDHIDETVTSNNVSPGDASEFKYI